MSRVLGTGGQISVRQSWYCRVSIIGMTCMYKQMMCINMRGTMNNIENGRVFKPVCWCWCHLVCFVGVVRVDRILLRSGLGGFGLCLGSMWD